MANIRISLLLTGLCLLAVLHIQCDKAPDSAKENSQNKKKLHLFILAGQSNMAGRGEVRSRDRKPPERVFKLSREGKWVPAVEPVHYDKPRAGVGPGRSFGMALAEEDTTIKIGLIPCAVGGSSVTTWKPGGFHEQTQSYPYDDCMKRSRKAMEDGVLKGILWHQGASDSNARLAPPYKDRLYNLVSRFRNDLNVPELPFIAGQLAHFEKKPWDKWRTMVNQANASLADSLSNTAFVSSRGLTDKGDLAHFDTRSSRELGKRYAEAYLRITNQ
ncbi:protein of unknown function [Fodinibius roseus]|uniref:Sialate O-acetylesterase domain-containing protein n=1 Tax=Fodinibius roseus TaxID=1194090 RepID=A0A1M5DSZ6_9BACT|nr:sialate O-acetylesterase [Fodinibius roseus]SHF70045.1 protein of unknown function [Fodinibius roseus]